jgi:predicted enzyme related to lactoylglutathione lyase
MLCIGDIHIYVSDFTLALRFWEDGLRLKLIEKEVSQHAAYAQLEFPDGGPALCLWWPVERWDPETQPPHGKYPGVCFDIATSDFDATLLRLLEHGGQQVEQIEDYSGLRTVTLADPDGNAFELLEIREDTEAEGRD